MQNAKQNDILIKKHAGTHGQEIFQHEFLMIATIVLASSFLQKKKIELGTSHFLGKNSGNIWGKLSYL